jgi:hypothetical protein
MHHACGMEDGVHLVNKLLDVERDLNCLLDASLSTSVGRLGVAGSQFEALSYLLETSRSSVQACSRPWRRLLAVPHTLPTRRKSSGM